MKLLRFLFMLIFAVSLASCEKKKTRAEIEADFVGFEEKISDVDSIVDSETLHANINDDADAFKGKALEELQKMEEEKTKAEEEAKLKAELEKQKRKLEESMIEENPETDIYNPEAVLETPTTVGQETKDPVKQQVQEVKTEPKNKDVIVDGLAQ